MILVLAHTYKSYLDFCEQNNIDLKDTRRVTHWRQAFNINNHDNYYIILDHILDHPLSPRERYKRKRLEDFLRKTYKPWKG